MKENEPDRAIIVRDSLLVAGVSILFVGCALYSFPLGLIVCGILFIYLGLFHR